MERSTRDGDLLNEHLRLTVFVCVHTRSHSHNIYTFMVCPSKRPFNCVHSPLLAISLSTSMLCVVCCVLYSA